MAVDLTGRTALVTGASSGIGLASAIALAQVGANVVLMGRGADALNSARDLVANANHDVTVASFVGNAVDEGAVKEALSLAHSIAGRLDVIVSVVGGPTFKPLLMRELADVREELDLNFSSAFLAVRHGVPLMETGGSIVCISTAAVTQPTWGLSVYAAAKAALERFVKAAAFELGGAGIRVNAIRPGATLPADRELDPQFSQMRELYASETPLGRIGAPEDIARVVRFLAGPESAWVTGQSFSVDGGMDQGKGPNLMDAFYGTEIMDAIRAGKPASFAEDMPIDRSLGTQKS